MIVAPVSAESEFELGVRCETLLTLAGGGGEASHDTYVGITGGIIRIVAPWSAAFRSRKLIDARGQVVLPGLINAHTHLAMTLLRGMADDLTFSDWLHRAILPTEQKLVSPEFVRAGTELAALECIRAGTTTVCDMYFYGEQVAETLDQAGMRALVAQPISEYPSPEASGSPQAVAVSLRRLEQARDRFSAHARIRPILGPHAPYSCSDELLRKVAEYSEENSLQISIHVSETRAEVENSLKTHGKTPVKRLHELGLMKGRAIFAHCVHLNDEDIALLAQTGTAAIYNPESNMKLGSGTAPIAKMLKAGVRVGIGTDGSASNNDLALFKEMDCGAKLQKLAAGDGAAITALQMLRLATIDGARALGLDREIGSIEVGKSADLILMDLEMPHMLPLHDLVSQIVYSGTGQEVSTVICAGKILMENRKFATLDGPRVFADARRVRDQIRSLSSPQ